MKYTFVVTNTGTDALLKDGAWPMTSAPPDDRPVKTGGNQTPCWKKGEICHECSQNPQNTTTNIATATGKDNPNTEVTDTDTSP
ncbi:MAG: hypothetical protein IPN52_11280 [Micrococcales bacterium]|nr:hypothetical protein [Micrococcales bacterium]